MNDAIGDPSGQTIRLTFSASEHHKTALKWIKHFEECTASRAKGAYRMLVLHGNNSLHSAAFDWYCLNHSIIPVNLPADSYQLVQPLDIGCFGPLKRAYDHEMNQFSKRNINHITDVELLFAFEAAYRASVTKDNVKGGFREAGLAPCNPDAVISNLDVKWQTPARTSLLSLDEVPQISETPRDLKEAISQSKLLVAQMTRHKSTSSAHILKASRSMAKGLAMIAGAITLLKAENHTLREANKAVSKRRKAKKERIRNGGTPTLGNARDL